MNCEFDSPNTCPLYDCLPSAFSASTLPNLDDTPKSLKSALNAYDAVEWKKVCDKEVASLAQKNVWTLVDRPTDKRVIRGMWLFKRKAKPDGTIKHKA